MTLRNVVRAQLLLSMVAMDSCGAFKGIVCGRSVVRGPGRFAVDRICTDFIDVQMTHKVAGNLPEHPPVIPNFPILRS